MNAIVLHGNKDLRFEDFSLAPPSHGEVLIRVKAAGLCHTDFNEYINGPLYVAATPHPRTGRSVPVVLGHEFSGEIVETGPGVTKLRVGDRVAVNNIDCCYTCELCRRGLFMHCPTAANVGFSRDGGYAQYAVVPEACCHLLRANVSYAAAALVEPFPVAMHAVRRANVTPGCRAAVVGGGTIGLCTLQALRACGATDVYVIEKSLEKKPFAERLGATGFIHSGEVDVREAILEATGGIGVDVSFECVGSEAAFNSAIAVVRPGGTICLCGLLSRPILFDWNEVMRHEKTIVTTLGYADEFPIVIAMLADGRLQADPMITRKIAFPEALEILTHFEEHSPQNVKILIDMDAA